MNRRTNISNASPSGSGAPRVSFCRYEYKYRLPAGLAGPIRAIVAAHLPHDKYSLIRPDHHYDISSLYIDSADLRLCRESLSSQKNRFKLRIRGYDDNPDSPVFLEIKRRLNTVILKDRCLIGRGDVGIWNESLRTAAADQFHLYRQSLGATPQALVRYEREAFESTDPGRLRVTFDRHLHTKITHKWEVKVGGTNWHPVYTGLVVLEIKFNGRYPSWLHSLVRQYQLQAVSVSKYTMSLHAGMPAANGMLAARAGA